MGQEAISLSGAQAGIQTDANHSKARIVAIDPRRVKKELKSGSIVIVAGFQGITKDKDVTTLGRGGSDTTAVALAVSLGARACERYTDTAGIYTADPRVVPEATRLKEISYDEMLEVATYGSKVMHPRAIELGQIYNMPILVASSFSDEQGTLIHGGAMEVQKKVTAISHDLDVAKITIVGVPDRPGIAASIFEPLAKAGVSVDTIVQNASIQNITDLTFTVSKGDAEKGHEGGRAHRQGNRRPRVHRRYQTGQGEHHRLRHAEHAGLRRPDVQHAIRGGHQHPAYYHLGDPHYRHYRRRAA